MVYGDVSNFKGMRVIGPLDTDASELEDFERSIRTYKIWQIRTGIWSSLGQFLDLPCNHYDLSFSFIWQGQLNISVLLTQGCWSL